MDFLLPRLALLAIMLVASVWSLLDRPASALDAASDDATCAIDASERNGIETMSRQDSGPARREIRWQHFLPGTLR